MIYSIWKLVVTGSMRCIVSFQWCIQVPNPARKSTFRQISVFILVLWACFKCSSSLSALLMDAIRFRMRNINSPTFLASTLANNRKMLVIVDLNRGMVWI